MQTDFYKAFKQDQTEAGKHGIQTEASTRKLPMYIEVSNTTDRKKDIIKLLEKMIRKYAKLRIKSTTYGLKQIQKIYWKREQETRRIYNAVLREIELMKLYDEAMAEKEYEEEKSEKEENEEISIPYTCKIHSEEEKDPKIISEEEKK